MANEELRKNVFLQNRVLIEFNQDPDFSSSKSLKLAQTIFEGVFFFVCKESKWTNSLVCGAEYC